MNGPAVSRALIFDCDGTLADTMPAHYQAWLRILAPFKISFPEDRFYALGGIPTVEISRMLFAEAGLAVDFVAIARQKEETFVEQIHAVQPVRPVVELARAHRGTVPMAVASGGYRRVVDMTLRHLGIADWFDAVVAAEDTRAHKPEPDVFLEAARRLGVAPAACTVYEDTDIGLLAARRAGMHGVDVRKLPRP